MLRVYYWLKIVWLSLKQIHKIHLGDKVILKTDKYPTTWTVINGVCSESWKLSGLRDGEEVIEVPRKDCKKIKTFQNYLGSYKFRYGFYMGYWYDIWCREGIQPWMRRCKIW